MNTLCSVLLVSLAFGIRPQHNYTWNTSMYQNFNFESFSRYAPTHKKINIRAIDYPLLNAAIFYETNRQRKKNRLPVFKHAPALEKSSMNHSSDMVVYSFFSHTSRIANKKRLSDRLQQVGLTNISSAENIAKTFALDLIANKPYYRPSQNGGYFSYRYKGTPIQAHTYLSFAKQVLKVWMKSPGHRRNILNPEYIYLGCGAVLENIKNTNEVPHIFSTQNFSSKDADYKQYPNLIDYSTY